MKRHQYNKRVENTPQWNNHPEKPAYFENLEKARQVRHANLAEDAPTAREALHEPNLWFDHCEKVGKTNTKVGRPKLPPEKLKRKPMSRNKEVRLMLAEHGITIDDDHTIFHDGNVLTGFKFLINGRIRDRDGVTMSAHQMLQLI